MIEDLVVDTNVLEHAQNPREMRFRDSVLLVRRLLECTALLCVDEGFSLDRARNKSHICHEYLERLTPGSLPYQVLVSIASAGRIRPLPRCPNKETRRRILQIVRKPFDRVFLGVACSAISHTMVSHDYEDFAFQKRGTIASLFGVNIVDAHECCEMFHHKTA